MNTDYKTIEIKGEFVKLQSGDVFRLTSIPIEKSHSESAKSFFKKVRVALSACDNLDLPKRPHKNRQFIRCEECGILRLIYTSDYHQVYKCRVCQRLSRSQQVIRCAKDRRARLRETKRSVKTK
jgi:hypothetical protein